MAINTTFTTGAVLTAAQMNNLPWGIVGLQTLTTIFNTSGTNTAFQDTGMTLTINEIAGRRYRITATGNIYPSGGLQGMQMRLIKDSSAIRQMNFPSTVLDSGNSLGIVTMCYVFAAVASGSTTYKMQIRAETNNTAVSDYGDVAFPRQFFIEDIGAA